MQGNIAQSVAHLQQGLLIAEQMLRKEDEARIRHRLGLALWQSDDLPGARRQLETAARLFEVIRRELRGGSAEFKLGLYDLQTACYQALQRILVLLHLEHEALVVAERSRNRAFADLRLEQVGGIGKPGGRKAATAKLAGEITEPQTPAEIEKLVARQKASVLYYSLAAGYLYAWLIVPTRGIVKFHQRCLLEEEEQEQERPESEKGGHGAGGPLLETYIRNVRESLGIDTDNGGGENNREEEDEEEESQQQHLSGVWSNHLEELGDKLNLESDRTGFLRMVNRSSRLNASSYSLSSLFSVGSLGGVSNGGALATSRAGSTRSRRSAAGARSWQGPSSVQQLYQLLIEPMEDDLPEGGAGSSELLLVLEGELYLIPFPVLKGPNCAEYLCEKFSLLVVPSLTHLKTRPQQLALNKKSATDEQLQPQRLVVGNPRIPSSVTDHWGWTDLPTAEQEANSVAEILQTRPGTGVQATKELLLAQLGQAESVHLACHVSWKLSALVVSPAEFPPMESRSPGGNGGGNPRRYSIHSDTIHEELEEDHRSEATTMELPALSEFLLTAADLLKLKLTAKLVVISSCYTRNNSNRGGYSSAATADGLVSLSRALLAAGAQCVMVCLWPVPELAVRLVMKAFYSSLLQGSRVSRALAEAMTAVQTTKYFQHPANWAGFLLIGQDVRLTNKVNNVPYINTLLEKLTDNANA